MRIGIVCPYSWDIPGGVQAHVRDLAETLLADRHQVSVLAPGEDDAPGLAPYVVAAGKAVPIPYNGSVARLQFGFVSAARVRNWLREGAFDVVHVHEPAPPSLSMLTCFLADAPLVATFHAATAKSRWLNIFDGLVQAELERLSGRIAVSQAARKVIVEHLGGDAVVIPNGVNVARYQAAATLPGYPRPADSGGTLAFIGRYDEPRKGMAVLIEAIRLLLPRRPGLRLLIAGRGKQDDFLDKLPAELTDAVVMLGQVGEEDKVRLLRSVDAYVAPNTGGESFGVILLEAMAAGTPIVASDLDAFRRVLDDGRAGLLYANRNPESLAGALERVLSEAQVRSELSRAGLDIVGSYDWPVIAAQILRVYEIAIAAAVPR